MRYQCANCPSSPAAYNLVSLTVYHPNGNDDDEGSSSVPRLRKAVVRHSPSPPRIHQVQPSRESSITVFATVIAYSVSRTLSTRSALVQGSIVLRYEEPSEGDFVDSVGTLSALCTAPAFFRIITKLRLHSRSVAADARCYLL